MSAVEVIEKLTEGYRDHPRMAGDLMLDVIRELLTCDRMTARDILGTVSAEDLDHISNAIRVVLIWAQAEAVERV